MNDKKVKTVLVFEGEEIEMKTQEEWDIELVETRCAQFVLSCGKITDKKSANAAYKHGDALIALIEDKFYEAERSDEFIDQVRDEMSLLSGKLGYADCGQGEAG